MITVLLKARFIDGMYRKSYPTELQDHINQDEFSASVDALNKPLRATAIRTAFLSLADLLFVGGFIALVLVMSANFSGHSMNVVIYLATTMFLLTQFMFTYVAIIWNIQLEDERERIVNDFNANDQQRGIKWKYSRRPFWSIRNKQSSVLIEVDDSLSNHSS